MDTSNFQPFRDLVIVARPCAPHYVVELWLRAGEADWNIVRLMEVADREEAEETTDQLYRSRWLDRRLLAGWARSLAG